ncbi:MAG: hypothetical protein A2499_07240 [Stygiobacter sp. RIFOXYC12_FULL_38_8]|nr:MAG: hypothetical protein A2X62_05220 [Stygiobacter sp. GWC2_38_9]OGU84097.1 MAG: hypothetical protein A2279_09975 [Stygiobacter sp. RIFOXYA12_FULL_38_9]OGV09617.1 MAG: hypothetical protein A2299_00770 [Stygiobacter sp. RIFOXYB2_FULL_37_11]OGV12033.1 MAG: hypothetical protein A2237_00095 [Stygiobacter sp. RIFOXYA2_FULL_38_8]OGV16747.1 MAG: hypothetical protein A2440_05240 [Stygiobacter sp. RIFOXYC2_FULL_38_25]OGV25174.1 MAG: hypothetical protein A2499_07240 [Stygiobacter sp. RIFOXYC12_FULL_
MSNQFPNIEHLLADPVFEEIKSLGLIDELALRNYYIKSEYKKLRKTQTQINSLFTLSEKYHLSFDAIHTIVFRQRKQKSIFLG